jgi:hypothetical protein
LGTYGENFTYISSVVWLWSYERFLKVRERSSFSIISMEYTGGQRRSRRRIPRVRRVVGTWRNRRRSRHLSHQQTFELEVISSLPRYLRNSATTIIKFIALLAETLNPTYVQAIVTVTTAFVPP